MAVPYRDDIFVVIEVIQRKNCLAIEAWHYLSSGDDPRDHQPPLRLRYTTVELQNPEWCLAKVGFGDLLRRMKKLLVVIAPIDGNGRSVGRAVEIPTTGEPEFLGLIKTGK